MDSPSSPRTHSANKVLQTPEQLVRQEIDRLLTAAGWIV
jgi:hypothetical protein